MDKNQFTGLMLIFLMLMIYFQFFAPNPQQEKAKQIKQTQLQQKEPFHKTKEDALQLKDSATAAKMYGEFAPLLSGKPKDIVLENEHIKFTFSTEGGKIKSVLLKKYLTYDKKPLVLLDEKSSVMSLFLKTQDKKNIDIFKLFYQSSTDNIQVSQDKKGTISFKLNISEGKSIEQIYSLSHKTYQLGYALKLKGFDKEITQNAEFQWVDKLKRLEEDLSQSRYYTTINYSNALGEYNYLTWPSNDLVEQTFNQSMHWIAFKQKFFTSAFVSNQKNIQNIYIANVADLKNDAVEKTAEARFQIPIQDLKNGKANFELYFGPNKFYTLKDTKIENFDKNVYLGWSFIGSVSRYVVVPLFALLEKGIGNYGLIIILMVIIIKTLLLPLTYTSYKSMAKMKVLNDLLKPELDAFKEKQGLNKTMLSMEEQQKVNQEQMRLYQELGTSPFAAMSGCFPLLLQMPILFAMFMFFPSAIELRQEGFLWAHDLSTYDSILRLPFNIPGFGSHISLFTLLMTLSTIALTYYTNQNQPNMNPQMKYIGYILPVVFLFVLNSYPAGLSFYYLVQNLVSMGQQQAIKKPFINEEKIKAKFEEYKKNNKDKPAKKSSFMQKLEEAQKKAQERAEAKKMKDKKPNLDKNKKDKN